MIGLNIATGGTVYGLGLGASVSGYSNSIIGGFYLQIISSFRARAQALPLSPIPPITARVKMVAQPIGVMPRQVAASVKLAAVGVLRSIFTVTASTRLSAQPRVISPAIVTARVKVAAQAIGVMPRQVAASVKLAANVQQKPVFAIIASLKAKAEVLSLRFSPSGLSSMIASYKSRRDDGNIN